MKKTKKKAILIALPIILVLVLLFVILICLFSKKEPVLNGGIGQNGCDKPPYIVYDGNEYHHEEDLFFEVQENWEELDTSLVDYTHLYYPYEEDIIYYDTTQPYPYDLYLRVSEEYFSHNNIGDYTEGYVRFNFYYLSR